MHKFRIFIYLSLRFGWMIKNRYLKEVGKSIDMMPASLFLSWSSSLDHHQSSARLSTMASLIPWSLTSGTQVRQTILPWGSIVIISYLILVRCLRWQRYTAIHRKYAGTDLATLTPDEAQEIAMVSFVYDMPNLSTYSLSFALFKTYGIVSVKKHRLGCAESLALTEKEPATCMSTAHNFGYFEPNRRTQRS